MENMIGKPAPAWNARTYISGESVNISSEDMKGKWYLI
jgi:alkyl hydroperoxide reductase subunit AhpC